MSGLVRAESLFRARRRARRLRTARPALMLAIATTVVGGLLWVGYASPLMRLSSITVKGTSRLSTGQVLAAAGVRPGVPLVEVPVGAVRGRVASLPLVAGVRVDRDWPNRLVIEVTERRPVAAVSSGGAAGSEVVLVDSAGVAFAAASSVPAGLVDLRVPLPTLGSTSGAAAAALDVWAQLPPGVRREIRWMRADSADAVSFELARGSTVVWGSPGDSADKLSVLAALMRSRASIYDVSTPSVAITR
ncbi:MAG: cell division protein FtsQ [Pseudonocardiales bacterium]|nr:cell division protein FtsQ [Pseudonocardiales bacterium]